MAGFYVVLTQAERLPPHFVQACALVAMPDPLHNETMSRRVGMMRERSREYGW
jgi:hypothetical protein